MNLKATAANAAWYASNLPAWLAFRRALNDPRQTQDRIFRAYMRQCSRTAFGRDHRLTADCPYDDFCQRVPIRNYSELEPWIHRIRGGESHVLTTEPVRRFATTSGTTSAQKLIPYTKRLHAEFNHAIGPWVVDLFSRYPRLFGGRAFWSISPFVRKSDMPQSAVPIGFEDDSEYLGGVRRRIVDAVMAVPSSVRRAETIEGWRTQTREFLQAASDLRLISIWHPSFLDLLFDGPDRPQQLWPTLTLISCWADGHAVVAAADLARQYLNVVVQPKGLLATEGVVSIPFADRFPLAIRSHFFEFIDERHRVFRAHELLDGTSYEVVLTTGGGLYRYRLGDLIRVEGFVTKTPSIRFLGKTGLISDRFGEKLSEPFVAGVISRLSADAASPFVFAMLAPDGPRYHLYVQGIPPPTTALNLDKALCANSNYAYCRDLGQLKPCRVTSVFDGYTTFLKRMIESGQQVGDIKPVALSKLDGWDRYFNSKKL